MNPKLLSNPLSHQTSLSNFAVDDASFDPQDLSYLADGEDVRICRSMAHNGHIGPLRIPYSSSFVLVYF